MGLRITNDFIFQYIFGREEHIEALRDLVNAVLIRGGFRTAASLVLQPPQQERGAQYLKKSVLDILARDSDGREFNVEIQVLDPGSYVSRSLFYWSQVYSRQLEKGDEYHELRPVVCINIVDFVLFKDLPDAYNCFLIKHQNIPDLVLTEDLSIHFVELRKAMPGNDRLNLWARYLKMEEEHVEVSEMTVLFKRDQIFADVHSAFQRCTQDEAAWFEAYRRDKFQRDQVSRLRHAEREATKRGMDKGMEKGRMEALQETARSMKSLGMEPEVVAKVTGLSHEELGSL